MVEHPGRKIDGFYLHNIWFKIDTTGSTPAWAMKGGYLFLFSLLIFYTGIYAVQFSDLLIYRRSLEYRSLLHSKTSSKTDAQYSEKNAYLTILKGYSALTMEVAL